VVSIGSPKRKVRGKIIIAYAVPFTLGYPMYFSYTTSLLYV
jgi:hypothetical protein